MPLTWALEQCPPNAQPKTTRSTPVPSFQTAKQNYDVGNRELLSVKLALEEWRHWLEVASLPFLVWTTRTWSTSALPRDSTPAKLAVPCFSPGSTLPFQSQKGKT